FDDEFVRDEFLARSLVPGNHTCDGFVALIATADSDTNVVSNPQALATARVIDRHLHRSHRNKLACLPCPRKMALGIAPEPTTEDSFKRGTLLLRSARMQVQNPCPRRARLVVVVAARQRNRQAGQVNAIRLAILNQPRKNPHADAMR